MADDKNKIVDMGEKIGGARKDFYGLAASEIDDMTEAERAKNLTKAKLFPKPDYEKLYSSGEYTKDALYFQSKIYKALPPAPKAEAYVNEAKRNGGSEAEATLTAQKQYVEMINMFQNSLKEVKDANGIYKFSSDILTLQGQHSELLKPLQRYYDSNFRLNNPFKKVHHELVKNSSDLSYMRGHLKKDAFLYTDEEEKLSKLNIIKVEADTVTRQYQVSCQLAGTLEYSGSDTEEQMRKAILNASTGRFSYPSPVKIENGNLHITGGFRTTIDAKTVEEAQKKTAEIIKSHIENGYFGDVQSVSYGDVDVKNYRETSNCLRISQGGTRYYFYNQPEEAADPANYKEGSYLVIPETNSGLPSHIIAMNATYEEAKQAGFEYIDKVREKQKAVSDARRKGKLPPPQLSHINRVGEDYRDGINTGEAEFLQDGLSFRGIEFGNWENQNDRQTNLNMTYESFKDMTKVLDISEKDASLGGKLALAFGSRGHGSALAHFEPDRNVINLTKMKGAGAGGHEWGHALDYAIARAEERNVTGAGKHTRGLYETDFALRDKDSVLHGVVNAMLYTPEGKRTKFYEDAIYTDSNYATSDKGYWQSEVEMFARAFHVYLKDKLAENGIRNDYLCGLAEYSPMRDDETGELHYTYPIGEERKRINAEFDKLVEVLKEKEFFHEKEPDKEHKIVKSEDGVSKGEATQEDVQLSLEEALVEKPEPKKEAKDEPSVVSVKGMTVTIGDISSTDLSKNGLDINLKNAQEDELRRIIVTHDRDNDTIHVSLGGLSADKPSQFEYKANNKADNEQLAKQLSELIAPKYPNDITVDEPEYTIDTMHIVYVKGSVGDIDVLKEYTNDSPDFATLWSADNDCFEISEGDYTKYLQSLQSPTVQGNAELIGAISRIEQQLDEAFPEPSDRFFDKGTELEESALAQNENGSYSQTKNFQIGEHTEGSKTEPITVSIGITADNFTDKVQSSVTDFSYKVGDKVIADSIEDIPKDAEKAVKECLEATSLIVHEKAEKIFEAGKDETTKEGAEKPMAENETSKAEETKPQRQPFNLYPALKSLEEALKEHEPYAIMTISTSGLAKDSTGELMRAVVQEYAYDSELKQYAKGNTFDKQVAVAPEALNAAYDGEQKYKESDGKEGYPYFTRAGIDYNAYMRGEGVLSKEDFTKEFKLFMESMKQGKEDMLLICTSGTELTLEMLNRVSPEAELPLAEKQKDKSVISEVRLAKEYFSKTGATDIEKKLSPTLENVALTSMKPSASREGSSFIHDVEKMRDFKALSKEDFLASYNYLKEAEYDLTAKDMQRVEEALTGTDKRSDVMNAFVTHYGREAKILESEYTAHWREADVASREQLSRQGKEKYENASFEHKLEILATNNRSPLNVEGAMDRSSDAQVNKLLNVLEKKGVDGEGHNKGFTVLIAATTGIEGRGENRTGGAPIQVTAKAFEISDNGQITPADKKSAIVNYAIQADERSIVNAENNARKTEYPYDAFKDAGINVNEYKAGFVTNTKGVQQKLHSRDEAVMRLGKFFKEFPASDYPIISNGEGTRDKSLNFAQDALKALGNIPALEDGKNNINFTKAYQEYSYVAYHKENVQNPMINEDELKTFKLADMYEAMKTHVAIDSLAGTNNKSALTAVFISNINEQALELYRPEILQQRDVEKAQKDAEKAEKLEAAISDYEKQTGETVERPSEVKFDSLEDTYIPNLSDIVDNLNDVTAVPVADTREHGNLYSDKQGDTREIFIAEGEVHKVGEIKIPHVSEALKDAEKVEKPVEKPEKAPEKPVEKPAEDKSEDKLHRMSDKSRERSSEGNERGGRRIVRPDRTDRAFRGDKSAENRPVPDSSAPSKDSDNSRLLDIIEKQNELIQAQAAQMKEVVAQNQILTAQTAMLAEKVVQAMETQNKMFEYIVQQGSPEKAQEAARPIEAPAKSLKDMTADEKINYIESVKDTVAEIKNSVPLGSKESVSLSNANANLSTAQKHIERQEQEKKTLKIAE